jgi:hypothetical protein
MTTILKGLIFGMEQLGAVFIKIEGDSVYFDIPSNTSINDPEKLKRSKLAFKELAGLTLKVKYLK